MREYQGMFGDYARRMDAVGTQGTTQKKTQKTSQKKNQRKRHRGLKALVVVIVVVAVLVGGTVVALAVDDDARTKQVPSTTILDNEVDVSGMTAEELEKTIRARAKNGITTSVELSLAGKTYELDLAKLGSIDTKPTVDQAFAPYREPALERYGNRVVSLVSGGDGQVYHISTSLAPSAKKLKKLVSGLAKKIDQDASEATYQYSNGKLVTTKAKTGVKVDVDATVKSLRKALSGTAKQTVSVKGVAEVTKPKTSKAGQAIYVDTGSCTLYLYQDGKARVSYPCTPGKAGYETPKGDWTLSYKDPAPVWQNPHSDWSASMPETIEPGESNPLGLRALAVSCGGGIFIHGTTNTGELGSPGSHGCVRLANANIVSLYDMVSAGIPIFIR